MGALYYSVTEYSSGSPLSYCNKLSGQATGIFDRCDTESQFMLDSLLEKGCLEAGQKSDMLSIPGMQMCWGTWQGMLATYSS